ncbi:hypothetical protein AAVH_32938 [Aphelenchoides avenae]|nr:hypothetical protein AAVH_32938 [Aphelenchus avenae]
MSCQSIAVTYGLASELSKVMSKESGKGSNTPFANKTFPSLARSSKVIAKYSKECQQSCINFPKALCNRCRELVHFRAGGFCVPCVCKFKGEICEKCKQLDLVKTILNFAGETGVSKCNSGYKPVIPISKAKTALHEYLCTILRCNLDKLVETIHRASSYYYVCRLLKSRKLTCKYLDDAYTLEFERFTYNGAEKTRVSYGSVTTVAQYLQAKRGLVLDHPELPCIVTRGKPYKYPLECVMVETESKQ